MNYKKAVDVNSSKFRVSDEDVIWEDDKYSLAFSEWNDQTYKTLGARNNYGTGYPKGQWGTPTWLMIPYPLSRDILISILTYPDLKEEQRKRILNAIDHLKKNNS